jgi:porphobilinogen deaminase
VRSAHEAEVHDICGMFALLDALKVLSNCIFVAVNLKNLPKFGPEELNIAAVVDRQVLVEATVKDMAAAISQLTSHRDSGLVNAGETSKQVALV